MNDRTRNIIVGITALAGLAGLALLLTIFGWLPQLVESGYAVRIELPNASGLISGSRVKLTGIDVGYIDEVEFQPPPKRGVAAMAVIREEVRIPREADVLIEQPLLTGSPWVAIEIGDLEDAQLTQHLPTDDSAVIKGRTLTLGEKLMSGLQTSIEEELAGPLQNLAEIQKSFTQLSEEWTRVGASVNRLISRDKDGREGELLAVINRTNKRLDELESALAEARGMFQSVEKAADEIGGTASTMKETSTRFRDLATNTNQRIAKFAETAEQRVDELADRYVKLADDLSQLTQTAEAAVRQSQSSDGTLGKLMTDPALYDNLNESAIRIEQMMDEIILLVEKWKNEGLPINF